jgi:DNA topoisomerase-1
MRTDSVRIAGTALDEAREWIGQQFPADLPPAPVEYAVGSKAQDAHEAIRPSNVFLAPDAIKPSLTNEQYRLYKLIWSRFLACQMTAAVYDGVTVDTAAGGYVFRAKHESMKFPGFMAVYVEGRDDDGEADESPLPELIEGDRAALEDIKKEQKFTQPPPR